jgi:transcriptional regulator with XRE-family HTH domain
MARSSSPRALAQFGNRVRHHRHARGWTIEQLAERADLHWTYVGSVERGQRNVSLINIVRLAAALRVDPSELVKGLKA